MRQLLVALLLMKGTGSHRSLMQYGHAEVLGSTLCIEQRPQCALSVDHSPAMPYSVVDDFNSWLADRFAFDGFAHHSPP
jgi:hypothetical protein